VHDVEGPERRRHRCVEKSLRDVEAEPAAVRNGLRRRLDAANVPAAASGAVLEKQAGSRADVEQPPAAAGGEQPLERVGSFGLHQDEPLAIAQVMLYGERLLRRVVLVPVYALQLRARRDCNDVLEPAGVTVDNRESIGGVERLAGVVLPRDLLRHLQLCLEGPGRIRKLYTEAPLMLL